MNFTAARDIVNGSDRADLIAGYAQEWLKKLPQYTNGNLNMQPSTPATPPTQAQTQSPTESSFKGTEIIIEIGFQPDQLIAFHFIHVGTTTDWGTQGQTTAFQGKSIRWLLTRVPQTRSFENMSLADIAATFTHGFGVSLAFEGEGLHYEHVDMSGITPFQLLQREARNIGFRITDDRDKLIMEPAARPQFTNFVVDADLVISATFNDQARAANNPACNSGCYRRPLNCKALPCLSRRWRRSPPVGDLN